MNKISTGTLLFFLLAVCSYGQEKATEKGNYISTAKGERIKFRLLEENKYEMVFLYGKYEKKGDTLYLGNQVGQKSYFSAKYNSGSPIANTVKISLKGKYITTYLANIYLGFQEGSLPVQYKKLSEFVNNDNLDFNAEEINFEINRSQYFYLIYESSDVESFHSKYTLPKSVTEIEVDFQLGAFNDVQLKGVYSKENEEYIISDLLGKNLLVFKPENQIVDDTKNEVPPDNVESKKQWTYAEKEITGNLYPESIADSAATAIPKPNFTLKVEKNLTEALKVTKKTSGKFLVIYYDPKNKNAKSEFDQFIQSQSVDLGYFFESAYEAKYDLFNYYLASEKDKNWIKSRGIKDEPSVIVVNADGTVLSISEGTLDSNKESFYYYNPFIKKLNTINAFVNFSKSVQSKKVSDAELLKAFVNVSALDNFEIDDYDYSATVNSTEAVKSEDSVVQENEATVDTIVDYYQEKYKLINVKFDKKDIQSYWQRVLDAHQKDTQPNMDLVHVIIKEIKNKGFSKQFFRTQKTFEEADFTGIAYLLKHYDAILTQQENLPVPTDGSDYSTEKIHKSISDALYKNSQSLSFNETSADSQKKTLDVYKKLIAKSNGNAEVYKNYFGLLSILVQKLQMQNEYIEEYDAFFNKIFDGTKPIIEKLDDLYSVKENYRYEMWTEFKREYSDGANVLSWFVVINSKNPDYIKKAIKWSETSLLIEKNNPYYLDTLSQLYYKNGEKERAIKTQELAIKFGGECDEDTKSEMANVLQKMKNGTY